MLDDLRQNALHYHREPVPGKVEITATKSLITQRDLALAYSPGVAAACEAIVESPASPQGATDLSPGPSPREVHIWTGTLGANSPVSTSERFATVNQFVFVPEPP